MIRVGSTLGIRGLDVCLLTPIGALSHEHVSRACTRCAVIAWIPIHACFAAGFVVGSNRYCFPGNGYRGSEMIIGASIGCFQIRLLGPGVSLSHEHICRARSSREVVPRVSIDPGGAAGVGRE